MSTSSTFDLEKLIIRYPKAKLRGIVTAQLNLSGSELTPLGHLVESSGTASISQLWIRRGHDLRLELAVSVDGEPVDRHVRSHLEEALLYAKMWQELDLHAITLKLDRYVPEPGSNSCLVVGLQYNAMDYKQDISPRYKMCYQIPAQDVAPPPGIEAAELDVLKLNFNLIRQKPRVQSRKRRKIEGDLFNDSGSENELLLTPDEDPPSEVDAMIAMLDAGLRLNISYAEKSKMRGLTVGVSAKFLATPTSLSMLAPSVFGGGYLKAVAMRAALLPTIAHALSQSLYEKSKSPSLRSKLRGLLSGSRAHDAGEDCSAQSKHKPLTRATRFNSAQASLWRLMQQQLLCSNAKVKLSRITSRAVSKHEEEDEDLFDSQLTDKSMSDNWFKGDDLFQHSWVVSDDDDLFIWEDFDEYAIDNDNLFDMDDAQAMAVPSSLSDSAMLGSDEDDDLLLDIFLDEGRPEE